jgi:hypothetical protein
VNVKLGDHEQPLEPRERGDDLLDHPVRKVFLLGVATHVLEGQDGDGRLVRERERLVGLGGCRGRKGGRAHRIEPYWSVDVLERLLTEVIECKRCLAAHLPKGIVRQVDATGLTFILNTRGQVDPVAKDELIPTRNWIRDPSPVWSAIFS